MNSELKEKFPGLWKKYFSDAEHPVAFCYTDGDGSKVKDICVRLNW